MMSYLFLLWSILLSNPTHVGHIAEYHYQLDGTTLNLKFIIEQEELLEFGLSKDCNLKEMTALCTIKYLNKNSTLTINGEKVELMLQGSATDSGHLIIDLSTNLNSGSIEEITIHNNCFYEFLPKFKNRMVLNVGKFQGSYLLSKNRNKIHLK